ncbi:MAG: hypothetical protein QOI66_137 [Myxococcales bacterium]|jgi:hypothetical protein|nr:hypothetical protein [Myxococcales bacterium]
MHNRAAPMSFLNWPPRLFLLSLILVTAGCQGARSSGGDTIEGGRLAFVQNGLPSSHEVEGGKGMTDLQAMLWKYTARCALREDQELTAPGSGGQKFRGSLGVAPEWYGGTCDRNCQEKVSSCLIALTNRTGKHVALSLLSSAATMTKSLLPSESDLGFPHQEGAFFGNVFSAEAFSCHGRGVKKGPQVKRLCALEPPSCSGFAQFVDAGDCQDACTMSCKKLSDGTERCAAVSCKDPHGKVWAFPITTYLRNQIEANNADVVTGLTVTDDALTDLDDGDSATFKSVDFGAAGSMHQFAATLADTRAGRIDIWIDGAKAAGTLTIKPAAHDPRPQTTSLVTAGISGSHDVTLKFFGGTKLGRLTTIEFR